MGTSGLRYADGLGSGGSDAVAISTAHEYRVLAVDDQAAVVTAVRRLLRSRGFHVEPCTDPQEALALLESDPHRYDLLMLDVSMPTMSGIEMLARIKEIAPDLPVIMLTGDDRAQTAVAALKAGAFNYLTKPLSDPDTVALVLARAGHHGSLQRRARELEHKISLADRFPRMIGESAPMRDLFVRIEKLAQTNATVLIRGESGTGKELVAREIHERSSCGRGPYVALNCGAIPETLIDSELFGHVRGAFTGAIANKLGVFGEANQGTLFLDEIGELPVHVQPRLLRVLQEREVRPVGSNRARVVDVRVIAATHVDLDAAVENGEFRADLYYRLNVVTLHLPPLRERLDDLPILSRHLLHKHALRTNRERVPRFTPEAMDAMLHYGWPGNIRELENAVQHALALVPGEEIGLDLLPRRIAEGCPPPRSMVPRTRADAGVADDGMSFKDARKQAQDMFERTYLHRLLTRTQGNVSEAARLAGLDRSNFRRVLARHDIDPETYRV